MKLDVQVTLLADADEEEDLTSTQAGCQAYDRDGNAELFEKINNGWTHNVSTHFLNQATALQLGLRGI